MSGLCLRAWASEPGLDCMRPAVLGEWGLASRAKLRHFSSLPVEHQRRHNQQKKQCTFGSLGVKQPDAL